MVTGHRSDFLQALLAELLTGEHTLYVNHKTETLFCLPEHTLSDQWHTFITDTADLRRLDVTSESQRSASNEKLSRLSRYKSVLVTRSPYARLLSSILTPPADLLLEGSLAGRQAGRLAGRQARSADRQSHRVVMWKHLSDLFSLRTSKDDLFDEPHYTGIRMVLTHKQMKGETIRELLPASVERSCLPCQLNYDFIVKVEDITREMEFVLFHQFHTPRSSLTGLKDHLLDVGVISPDTCRRHFSVREALMLLHSLYMTDQNLFGYFACPSLAGQSGEPD